MDAPNLSARAPECAGVSEAQRLCLPDFLLQHRDEPTFERHPFILGVRDGCVKFTYRGWYRNLVRQRITPQHVVWASRLLGRLSDTQWHDAFRAGGYDQHTATSWRSPPK